MPRPTDPPLLVAHSHSHPYNPRMARLFVRHPSGVLVANTAMVVGDITMSPGVTVWFSAVVRELAERYANGEVT